MKNYLILIVILSCFNTAWADSFQAENLSYQTCFTPGENCTEKIVEAIDAAKNQVLVQAYNFTSAPIARALVDAHKRGVDVKVILDKSQKTQRYSSSTFLAHAGIPTFIDYKPAIAHNKIMIIDQTEIITGSFNFTTAAQNKNAENLLILRTNPDSRLVRRYVQNWQTRYALSLPAQDYKPGRKRHTKTYF